MLANTKRNVVGHAQVWEQGVVLKHHADATFFRGQGKTGAGDDFARKLDFTLVNRLKTGNRPQRCGFAATRGAEQATNITSIEVQIEVLHHALALIATGQIPQVEQ